MWERINVRLDEIQEIANTKEWNKLGQKDIELKDLWPVVREIDYLAYLILNDEIKDKIVLDYYKTPLSQYIDNILKYYTPLNNEIICIEIIDTLINLLRNGVLVDRMKR